MEKISSKNVAKAIHASTKGKSGIELDHALSNTVEFLAKKNLLGKSTEILKYLQEIEDIDSQRIRAKVESKNPLTSTETKKIEEALKERYKAHEVILKYKEDPTLIGGIRIEGKDEVIDLTLKNKINQLQEYLLQN